MAAFRNPLKLFPINKFCKVCACNKKGDCSTSALDMMKAHTNKSSPSQILRLSMVQTWVMVLLSLPRFIVTASPQMRFMLMLVSWVRAMLAELAWKVRVFSRNTRFHAEVVVNHLSRNIPLRNYWTFKIPNYAVFT